MTVIRLRFGIAHHLVIASIIVLGLITIIGSGGGGGDGDVAPPAPPPGGVGTGADGVPIFWYPYDTNVANGGGSSVRETSDGGFIVAGWQSTTSFAPPFDVFLMKTDNKGAAQWKKRFAWPGGAEAFSVRQTVDGGYIVVGRTQTQGNNDVYLLKTDAGGNAVAGWPRTYTSSGAFNDAGYDVLPVNGGTDGYIVVGGGYNAADSDHDIYVLRTDAAGNALTGWPKYYDDDPGYPCGETGRAIAEASGGYVIAGYSGCGWSGVLLKIDGNGTEQWLKVYGSPAISQLFQSVAVTAGGEIVVAGYRAALSGQPPVAAPFDALVIKTDANGDTLWERTYGLAEEDEAFGVALTRDSSGNPDGGYVVAGFTQSFGGAVDQSQPWQYQDVHLIKVAANGNTVWEKVKGNRPAASDVGSAVFAASDGGIAVTGSSGGNVLLARFDKNGDTVNLGATDLSINVTTPGIIGFGNALDVAVAGVDTLTMPREIGAGALDLLIAQLAGDPVSDYCNGGGSYSFNPAPTAPLAAGQSFVLTLTACVSGPSGDQVTINGSATIAVDAASGDPLSPTYTMATTFTSIAITVDEVGATLAQSVSGGMRFARVATSGDFAELARSIVSPVPATFTVSETGGTQTRTAVIGPFTVSGTLGASGAYSYGAPSDSATVDHGIGPMTLTVLAPIQGTGDVAPTSGQFRALATDNSRLTATITNGTASLALDTDGDGSDDGTVAYSWDFLD